jgi:hypothetical protein
MSEKEEEHEMNQQEDIPQSVRNTVEITHNQ